MRDSAVEMILVGSSPSVVSVAGGLPATRRTGELSMVGSQLRL